MRLVDWRSSHHRAMVYLWATLLASLRLDVHCSDDLLHHAPTCRYLTGSWPEVAPGFERRLAAGWNGMFNCTSYGFERGRLAVSIHLCRLPLSKTARDTLRQAMQQSQLHETWYASWWFTGGAGPSCGDFSHPSRTPTDGSHTGFARLRSRPLTMTDSNRVLLPSSVERGAPGSQGLHF